MQSLTFEYRTPIQRFNPILCKAPNWMQQKTELLKSAWVLFFMNVIYKYNIFFQQPFVIKLVDLVWIETIIYSTCLINV